MAYRDAPLADARLPMDIHPWLPRPLTAIRSCLRPFVAERLGWGRSRPTKVSRTARELGAISNYARFAARHPDMPFYHREQILLQILKCCEDAKAGLP